MQIVGPLILIVFSIIIVYVRRSINNRPDDDAFKTTVALGDTLIKVKFIAGMVFLLFIFSIFAIASKR